jgi:hypothetical protein
MMPFEVIADTLAGLPRRQAFSGCAFSGAQHLFEAGVHFLFFNELAPVSLCDTFPHGGAKAGLFLKQAQRFSLHHASFTMYPSPCILN